MTEEELNEKVETLKKAKAKIWEKVLSYDEASLQRAIYEGQIMGINAAIKLFRS